MSKDGELATVQCWNCSNMVESRSLGRLLGECEAVEVCPNCGARFGTPPVSVEEFDNVISHPDMMPAHTLPRDEVTARIPAVTQIADEDVRAEVIDLTARAPAYFWWVPAASPRSEYHSHPVCRQRHGLWVHTLMGTTVVMELAESWVEQDLISSDERDYALAAYVLHDQRKKGPHGAFNESATPDHDHQMAKVVRKESNLPGAVADAIASHMGPWCDGPEPEQPVDHLVHNADMLASTASVTPQVTGPIHELLEDLGLEVIGDSE